MPSGSFLVCLGAALVTKSLSFGQVRDFRFLLKAEAIFPNVFSVGGRCVKCRQCGFVMSPKPSCASGVPGLVVLWSRFKGFGIISPLPEQRLALQTLGKIGTPDAQNEIRKILAAPGMPDSLLPVALQAAVTAKLSLPLRYITPWLEHKVPLVRMLAFSLIQTAIPPLYLLEPASLIQTLPCGEQLWSQLETWAIMLQKQGC